MGQWAAALGHVRQAAALDPRSAGRGVAPKPDAGLAPPLSASRAEAERGLTVAPADLWADRVSCDEPAGRGRPRGCPSRAAGRPAHARPRHARGVRGQLLGPLLGAGQRGPRTGADAPTLGVRRRPWHLGDRAGAALLAGRRHGARASLRRLGAGGVRDAAPGDAERLPATRVSRARAGLPGAARGRGAGGGARARAGRGDGGRIHSTSPTPDTCWRGSTSRSAIIRTLSTNSTRCSPTRTSSRPRGSRSTRLGRRSRAIRASSG